MAPAGLARRFCVGLVLALLAWMPAGAQVASPPEAPEWCAAAQRSLQRADGSPFDCAAPGGLRCIRMNNYGCVKQGRDPWLGTRFGAFPDGARDAAGHAIFESPAFSLRAIARQYEAYQRRGAVSALRMAELYSPWCDTLGSHPRLRDHARSCTDNPPAPAGWTGAWCRRPADGVGTDAQCRDCNCPDRVARRMVDGLGPGVEEPLVLADAEGRATPLLLRLISNKMVQELGVRPTEALLAEFAAIYRALPPR